MGHRRTVGTHMRQAVIDRVLVTPRDRIETFTPSEWIIDGCYDVESRQHGAGWTNDARSTAFSCPEGTRYRTWFRVEPQAGVREWRVLTYAERLDGANAGCTPEQRFSSIACIGADLLLTD